MNNETALFAQHGRVILRHSEFAGEWQMSPNEARLLAQVLCDAAEEAEDAAAREAERRATAASN